MKRIVFTILYSLLMVTTLALVGIAGVAFAAGMFFLATHSVATLVLLFVLAAVAFFAFGVYEEVDEDGNWNP